MMVVTNLNRSEDARSAVSPDSPLDPQQDKAPLATEAPAADVVETPVRFPARDGYVLSGLWVRPAERPRALALVSAATGYPKGYYTRFARDAAGRGVACLLYDYRGIGGSAPEDLAAMRMDYPDWGRLDLAGAIAALKAEDPTLPTVHVGHSVGGHLVGFAPNHADLDRHVFISAGSGFWMRHHRRMILLELYFWWVLGPLALAFTNHIPRGFGWSGEPLPRGVFTTWRRWCHRPRYFADELTERLRPHFFDAVRAPIRSWVFTDDPIATPAAARDILALYPSAPSAMVVHAPRDLGVARLGHDGALRAAGAPIWDEVWAWAAPEDAPPGRTDNTDQGRTP